MAGAAGDGGGRQDHDHPADWRDRAERPAHGLGKHNVRVRALSERIARVLGNALVGPVIAYVPEGGLSPPTGHMRFPGTITVPDDVFRRSLESAARSVRLHGFRNVVFLGDHGSTQAGEKAVAAKLNREWATTPGRMPSRSTTWRPPWIPRAAAGSWLSTPRSSASTPRCLIPADAFDPKLVRKDPPADAQVAGPAPADGDPDEPARSSALWASIHRDADVARSKPQPTDTREGSCDF